LIVAAKDNLFLDIFSNGHFLLKWLLKKRVILFFMQRGCRDIGKAYRFA